MKLADTLEQWRSDDLKKYVLLLGGKSSITRKADRISFISQALLNKASLRILWQQMDVISRRAISVAFHNAGEFNEAAFVAQYGSLPPRPKKKDGWSSYYFREPILFDLFVIDGQIPADLMPLLADLVLPPERFQLEGMTEAPAKHEHDGYVEDVTVVETVVIGRYRTGLLRQRKHLPLARISPAPAQPAPIHHLLHGLDPARRPPILHKRPALALSLDAFVRFDCRFGVVIPTHRLFPEI